MYLIYFCLFARPLSRKYKTWIHLYPRDLWIVGQHRTDMLGRIIGLFKLTTYDPRYWSFMVSVVLWIEYGPLYSLVGENYAVRTIMGTKSTSTVSVPRASSAAQRKHQPSRCMSRVKNLAIEAQLLHTELFSTRGHGFKSVPLLYFFLCFLPNIYFDMQHHQRGFRHFMQPWAYTLKIH